MPVRPAHDASAPPSTRLRARPPCATRRSGRRSGRSRIPPRRDERRRPRPRACPTRQPRCRPERARRPRTRISPGGRRCRRALEKSCDAVRCPAGRVDPGTPAERLDLDPRVLARNPRVGRSVESPMRSLDPCILDEGDAVLDRLVRSDDELDLPAGKRCAKLAELVRVARGEEQFQGRGAAAASPCAAVSVSTPPAARSSSASRSSRENGSRSAVACTSTSSPAPVMTTFMSVSALESSS